MSLSKKYIGFLNLIGAFLVSFLYGGEVLYAQHLSTGENGVIHKINNFDNSINNKGLGKLSTGKSTEYFNLDVNYSSYATMEKSMSAEFRPTQNFSWGMGYTDYRTNGYRGNYYTVTPRELQGSNIVNIPNLAKDLPKLSNGDYIVGGSGRKVETLKSYNAWVNYAINDDKVLNYSYLKEINCYHYEDPYSFIKDEGQELFGGSYRLNNEEMLVTMNKNYLDKIGHRESITQELGYKDKAKGLALKLTNVDTPIAETDAPLLPKTITWQGEGIKSSYPSKEWMLDISKTLLKNKRDTIDLSGFIDKESLKQRRQYLTNWRNNSAIDTSKLFQGIYELHQGKTLNQQVILKGNRKVNKQWEVAYQGTWNYFRKYAGESSYIKEQEHKSYPSNSYKYFAPELMVTFKPNHKGKYFLKYTDRMNVPTVYRLYKNGGENGGTVVGNPYLQPEYVRKLALGWEGKPTAKDEVKIQLYRQFSKDKMIYVKHFDSVGRLLYKNFQNLDKTREQGFRVRLKHEFNKRWSGYLDYHWQDGQLVNCDNEFEDDVKNCVLEYDIPKNSVKTGVKFEQEKWKANWEVEYVSGRMTRELSPTYIGNRDRYWLSNLEMVYQPQPHLNINLGIYNLFDKHYYEEVMKAGRNYGLGVNYEF